MFYCTDCSQGKSSKSTAMPCAAQAWNMYSCCCCRPWLHAGWGMVSKLSAKTLSTLKNILWIFILLCCCFFVLSHITFISGYMCQDFKHVSVFNTLDLPVGVAVIYPHAELHLGSSEPDKLALVTLFSSVQRQSLSHLVFSKAPATQWNTKSPQ